MVYVCENNLYGISGCVRDTMNISNISDRSKSYGIPGVTVDGNDILAVYDSSKKAIDYARKGNGPYLLEYKTWRHRGHWEGDLDLYRDKEEKKEWLSKDPIERFKDLIIKDGYATKDKLDNINKEIISELENAVEFAKESPVPDPKDLYTDVYV